MGQAGQAQNAERNARAAAATGRKKERNTQIDEKKKEKKAMRRSVKYRESTPLQIASGNVHTSRAEGRDFRRSG